MPFISLFILLRKGSQMGMSTQRTLPNFSKILLNILSEGLTLSSFSMCRGQNHLMGKCVRCMVSGRSPAFISSILWASLKNESQSWRLGKSSLGSEARTRKPSWKPATFKDIPSKRFKAERNRKRSSSSASKRIKSMVLFDTCRTQKFD